MAVTAFVLLSCLPFPFASAADQSEVRRVRGIVDRHQRWTGRVIITGDAQILDAAVTIVPGTIVEFLGQSSPTVLTVGSPDGGRGRLEIQSTPDAPVVFRSPDKASRGQVRVFLHGKEPGNSAGAMTVNGRPASTRPDTPMIWRNVHFEGMSNDAALVVRARGPVPGVEIDSCRLTDSGPVVVETDGVAPVTVSRNRIEATDVPAGLRLDAGRSPSPTGIVTVRENLMCNGIAVLSGAVRIERNQLIGLAASVTVSRSADESTIVLDNYVYCQSDDTRRYVFRSDCPEVAVSGNVFLGGIIGIYRGTLHMSGNVIAGAPAIDGLGHRALTHTLVASLPAGAIFENNLLLGPAHSMLVPQPPARTSSIADAAADTTRVRHNVFDTGRSAARVIHLNPPHAAPANVEITNNIFLHSPSLVMIEVFGPAHMSAFDHNAAAPPPRIAIHRTGLVRGDDATNDTNSDLLTTNTVDELQLPGPTAPSAETDWPQAPTEGLSVRALRQSLMSAYVPRPGSPLRATSTCIGLTCPPSAPSTPPSLRHADALITDEP